MERNAKPNFPSAPKLPLSTNSLAADFVRGTSVRPLIRPVPTPSAHGTQACKRIPSAKSFVNSQIIVDDGGMADPLGQFSGRQGEFLEDRPINELRHACPQSQTYCRILCGSKFHLPEELRLR